MIWSEGVREQAGRDLIARLKEFNDDPDRWRMKLDEPILGLRAMVVKDVVEPGKLILIQPDEPRALPLRYRPDKPKTLCLGVVLRPEKQFVIGGVA